MAEAFAFQSKLPRFVKPDARRNAVAAYLDIRNNLERYGNPRFLAYSLAIRTLSDRARIDLRKKLALEAQIVNAEPAPPIIAIECGLFIGVLWAKKAVGKEAGDQITKDIENTISHMHPAHPSDKNPMYIIEWARYHLNDLMGHDYLSDMPDKITSWDCGEQQLFLNTMALGVGAGVTTLISRDFDRTAPTPLS